MSGDSLRVTAAHLRELAAKQGQAAAQLTSATEVVEGVDTAVRFTHGVIAWSTAAAVEAVQAARAAAAQAETATAQSMTERLTEAAARYEEADRAAGAHLDDQLRPPR